MLPMFITTLLCENVSDLINIIEKKIASEHILNRNLGISWKMFAYEYLIGKVQELIEDLISISYRRHALLLSFPCITVLL